MHGDTVLADLLEIMQVGDTDADGGAPADGQGRDHEYARLRHGSLDLLIAVAIPASPLWRSPWVVAIPTRNMHSRLGGQPQKG